MHVEKEKECEIAIKKRGLAERSIRSVYKHSKIVIGDQIQRLSLPKEVDSLFELPSEVDANDDVENLLRTTKRFIGSSRALPSTHLEIQKLAEFALRQDNGSDRLKRYKVQKSGLFYPQESIKRVSFHRSEPLFLVYNSSNYVHIYSVENGVPTCNKMLHFDNFIVHQADWTSRNTYDSRGSLIQSPPKLQKPRISHLLRHRAGKVLPDLQRPGYSRGDFSILGYQELKHGKMYVSPDGVHVLLIGSEGSLFRVDLSSRRCEAVRQLASPVRSASFYDSRTCYIITSGSFIEECER